MNLKHFFYIRVGNKEQLNDYEKSKNEITNELFRNFKIKKTARIRIIQGNNFYTIRRKDTKDNYKYTVFINKKIARKDLIKVFKNDKVNMVVIEDFDYRLCKKVNITQILNEFTDFYIKCINLKNGENNYMSEIKKTAVVSVVLIYY